VRPTRVPDLESLKAARARPRSTAASSKVASVRVV
jgi:hypothetical protein